MKYTDEILQLVMRRLQKDDKRSLLSQITDDKSVKEEFGKIKNIWALISSTREMPEYKVENLYLNFQKRLNTGKNTFQLTYRNLLRYAAVFLLAIGLTSIFFYLQKDEKSTPFTKLRYTTVYADKGQVSKVLLPDSTVVWLNSDTKITYNTNFAVDNRDIKLEGQAFFEVRHDVKIPMTVSCEDLEIKDVGTKFDVSAYPDVKTIDVVLEEGKVELLNRKDKSFHYGLNPGEMAQYNMGNMNLQTSKVNAGNYSAWKDGILIFRDDPMSEVISRLERRYDVDIEVGDPSIYKSVFTATIKNETLDEIFKSVAFACSINYEIVKSDDLSAKTKIILQKKSN